ncbi:TPA: response regulator receiver domain [Vibrio diabolicus]
MSAFQEHCSEIVREYVESVIIIDDGANLGQGLEKKEPVDLVIEPEPEANAFEIPEPKLEKKPIKNPDKNNSHPLNTLELTNAFFNLGIMAGIHQPQIIKETPSQFAKKTVSASMSADIIILDWMLKKNDARYSQEVVKEILSQDAISGGRLRTIVIYTGEPKLNELRNKLWTFLDNNSLKNDKDFTIYSDSLNISFYNKSETTNGQRIFSEQDLPLASLKEFSTLVDGLVPTFAVKSASEIRRNIGRLTSKFSKNIDAAYLSHRSLLPSPEDAELFMLEMFVSHLRSLLAISKPDKTCLGFEAIKKWVDSSEVVICREIDACGVKFCMTKDGALEILENGLSSDRNDYGLKKVLLSLTDISNDKGQPLSKSKVSNLVSKDKLHELFAIYSQDGELLDSLKELSVLSLFKRTRTDIVKNFPYLTQGSVVYCIGSETYYLCVTPKCDTVRLTGKHNFSFAPLEEADTKFDLIIRNLNLDSYKTLRTQSKFYNLKHIEFSPAEDGRVQCTEDNERLVFVSETNMKYQWIGDLEELQAQNRVTELVGNLSRNGVDEMEWLRKQYQ